MRIVHATVAMMVKWRMMMEYKVSYDSDGKLYVDGPGDGLSYYGGTLWPGLRFTDKQTAERAAAIANTAYREGYIRAQADIRRALGQ